MYNPVLRAIDIDQKYMNSERMFQFLKWILAICLFVYVTWIICRLGLSSAICRECVAKSWKIQWKYYLIESKIVWKEIHAIWVHRPSIWKINHQKRTLEAFKKKWHPFCHLSNNTFVWKLPQTFVSWTWQQIWESQVWHPGWLHYRKSIPQHLPTAHEGRRQSSSVHTKMVQSYHSFWKVRPIWGCIS